MILIILTFACGPSFYIFNLHFRNVGLFSLAQYDFCHFFCKCCTVCFLLMIHLSSMHLVNAAIDKGWLITIYLYFENYTYTYAWKQSQNIQYLLITLSSCVKSVFLFLCSPCFHLQHRYENYVVVMFFFRYLPRRIGH